LYIYVNNIMDNLKLFFKSIVCTLTIAFITNACGQTKLKTMNTEESNSKTTISNQNSNTIDTATFGAGCFWCVEAVFQRLDGVTSVKSGYSGGTVKNPSYKEVCNGTTGHAEVCQITFDKSKITFDELLEVFWKTHDPTTLNRQGNDFGTQYRSAIFYHNEEQKQLAEKYKAEINKSGAYPNPIITEITAFTNYYPAEDYHQNYFNQNGNEQYCKYVIQPKVEKFEKIFKSKIKH
jgi:peptide-methionine (S)-S-oxide reductase